MRPTRHPGQRHVEGQIVGQIGVGLLVLLGVASDDTEEDARQLAAKIAGLRIFEDDAGKMNRSLAEVGGAMLVVSQFTLLGDCRKGRRPNFTAAAPPELAEKTLRGLRRPACAAKAFASRPAASGSTCRSRSSTTARSRCSSTRSEAP